MKFNPAIPIYIQIMDSIKKDIVTGALARGERIESVRALAEKFEVNLNTMQRACAELEREQIISTQRGVGSFVTDDESVIAFLKQEMSDRMVTEFLNGMKSIGYSDKEIMHIIQEAIQK
jgi:GntR family transcriptional regulator